MKRPLTKIKLVSLSSRLLVGLGVSLSGRLHPDGIICSEPGVPTYPDFDVEFGEYKLRGNLPEKFKNDTFDFSRIWTNGYTPSNAHEFGKGPYIHFIKGNFISRDREMLNSGDWNPKLQVYSGFKVHLYLIYMYFGVIGFLFVWWLLLLSRSRNQS